VPSVIDSPIWGITTSVGMGERVSRQVFAAQEAQPLDYTAANRGLALRIRGFCTQR